MKKLYFATLCFLTLFVSLNSFGQLITTEGDDPTQLVQDMLLGEGMSVFNVSLTGAANSIGTFQTGATPTNIGLQSGLLITTGKPSVAIGPNNLGSAGFDNGTAGDSLLTALSNQITWDATILEFDFVPQGDTMKFRYVFGSEEYPIFVNSMNDVFGFFVTGLDPVTYNTFVDKNVALVPNTVNTPVSINTINNGNSNSGPCINCTYYVNNSSGVSIQYNAFTTVLTAWCLVVPCTLYHIKISIADAGDHIYDSGVFLEEGSFSSVGIQATINFTNPNASSIEAIEGCNDAILSFIMPETYPDGYVIPFTISPNSTAIMGIDYDSIFPPLMIPPGGDSASIVIHGIADGITEGPETVILVIPKSICLTEWDTIYFTIIDYIPLEGSIVQNDTTTTCGQPLTLNASQSGGLGNINYEWSTGASGNSLIVNPTISSQFSLTVTDMCNISVSDSIMVSIVGPTADAGKDTAICYGEVANLQASGGVSYVWNNGNNNASITVSPTTTTLYVVTVTDVCSDIDTVKVTVHPLPVLTATTDADSICPGTHAGLGASGASTYLWSAAPNDPSLAGQTTLSAPQVSPAFTTIYTLTGTSQYNCVSDTTVKVTVKPIPSPAFTITQDTICEGAQTVVNYTGNAVPGSGFNWNFDNGQFLGSGPGPITVGWLDPGMHTVSLQITQWGCLSSVRTDSVQVIQIPITDFIGVALTGCPPLHVEFTDLTQNVIPGAQYQWWLGNGQTTNVEEPALDYTKSGVYTVSLAVANQYGCSDTMTKTAYVNVYPVPVAQMHISPERVSIMDPLIKFYDESMGNPVYWTWDFGDNMFSDLQNTMHVYSDTGVYLVTFIVENVYGCFDTAYNTVMVYPDNTIYFPNAFTPNGDGCNDFYLALGTNLKAYHIDIFSRWGELVFTSDDIDNGWDGRFKNQPAPVDTYTIIAKYKDAQGGKHSYYGTINLFR
jgi:gliding motility-associated-like protein